MSTGRLDGLGELEQWFLDHGCRLEFQLTNREGWAAVVLRAERAASDAHVLSADGADPLAAALEARAAFVRIAGGR
jgi:hypothetical protein